MLHFSDRTNPLIRKRNKQTYFVTENSSDLDSENSLQADTTAKTSNSHLDLLSFQKKRASHIEGGHIQESEENLLKQSKIRKSLQPSYFRDEDAKEEQTLLRHSYINRTESSVNAQGLEREEEHLGGFQGRSQQIHYSCRPTQPNTFARRSKHTKSLVLSQDQDNLNYIPYDSSKVNPRQQQQTYQFTSNYASNYYLPLNSSHQENTVNHLQALSTPLSTNKSAGAEQLRGTKNGFFINPQSNQYSIQQPSSSQQYSQGKIQIKKHLANIIQDSHFTPQFDQNSDNQRFSSTRIKSLINLSSTFKKIEELETNTTINASAKHDTSLSLYLQKNESSKMIQFAKKHSQQAPNMSVSPVDLLKKQPSKSALKSSSRPSFSSKYLLESLEDENQSQLLKENQYKQNTVSRNVKQTPSSLEEIPELENNTQSNYTQQSQQQSSQPVTQDQYPQNRIKRIIRNGIVIKKVKNDDYAFDNKEDETTQSATSSPSKGQSNQQKSFNSQFQFSQQTYPQQEEKIFVKVLSSASNSPKKRISKIQILNSIM